MATTATATPGKCGPRRCTSTSPREPHAIYDAMFGQAARATLEGFDIDETDVHAALRANTRACSRSRPAIRTHATAVPADNSPGFEPSPESYAPTVELLELVPRCSPRSASPIPRTWICGPGSSAV